MAIQNTVNFSGLNSMKYADSDADPYDRATQLANVAYNLDNHDHSSGKGLGVLRVQTASAPASAGQVRVNTNNFQWWGSGVAAVVTAVDDTNAQTIAGAKTFSAAATFSSTINGQTISAAASFTGSLAIAGALTGVTTLTTSGAINGQTISAAASFTGSVAVATQVAASAVRATGTTGLAGGPAAELIYDGSSAKLVGYNRTGAAYVPLLVDGSTVGVQISGVTRLSVDASGNLIQAGGYHSVGPTPATTGTIRLPNTGTVYARNAANSADYVLIQNGAADTVHVGQSSVASVAVHSAVNFPNILTTASAANAFLDGAASNNLLRSTSSARYKTDVVDLARADARRLVLGLRAVGYRSKAPADDPERRFVGLIAEEVAALDDRFVTRDGAGRPDWVQYPHLVAPMVAVVQDQERRLVELERRLAEA